MDTSTRILILPVERRRMRDDMVSPFPHHALPVQTEHGMQLLPPRPTPLPLNIPRPNPTTMTMKPFNPRASLACVEAPGSFAHMCRPSLGSAAMFGIKAGRSLPRCPVTPRRSMPQRSWHCLCVEHCVMTRHRSSRRVTSKSGLRRI